MSRLFKYLKYVLRHKWYVMIECFKHGLFYQGLVHDLSKFLPSEFFPYAEYFYGEGKNIAEFKFAWLLHQKRNKHHWEYWILHEEYGTTPIFDMPLKYAKEMFCDWAGAGKAMGKHSPKNDPYKETREWYESNKDKIRLSSNTRLFIESILWRKNVTVI